MLSSNYPIPPWRVLDRTSTQIMTSPASPSLCDLCSNSSCASRGGLTPACSLGCWILPGRPWITGQVWGAPTSVGAQPTMKDLSYTQAFEMLSEAIWRQIRETFPSTSKGFTIAFSCLSTFLQFSFFLSFFFFAFSLSPFSVIWTTWMLSLMLGDLTSDFKLRLFQLLFFSTQHVPLPLHTYTVSKQEVKTTRSLSIFGKKKYKQHSIRIRQSTSWSNAMAIFFFCASDRLYTQEGKKMEVSLWEGVNDMLKAFQMEGRLGMCHCKQAEMLGSSVSERRPE